MTRYLDVVFDIFAFSLGNPAVYYPLLLTLAFSALGLVAFLIKYIIRGSF